MTHNTINNNLNDTYHDDLIKHWSNLMFNQFMSHGLSGVVSGANDTVSDFIDRLIHMNILNDDSITIEDRTKLTQHLIKTSTDLFITEGSAGINTAVFDIYNIISQHR